MKKRILASLMAAAVAVSGLSSVVSINTAKTENTAKAEDSNYNYAEALQKSMFFYEVQQSGVLPDWNEVSWRDDCMTNDYVTGGFFDAGDHLKFALTNAYTATLLGWGLYMYEDGVKSSGQYDLYCNNLKFVLDYLQGCDQGDSVVYMIGDGSFDHTWWGSAEVYMLKYKLQSGETERPYYTCEDSCIDAQMAAALTTGYLCFKDTDPEKAESYLTSAKDLFKRADTLRALGDDAKEDSYYQITSFYDDLFLAADFLYMATGEQSYMDLCTNDYVNKLDKESQSTEIKFTWGYCWDDVTQGAILLYAINTKDATWINQVKKHLEYWTTGYGGKQVSYTPDGLAWLFQWGSTRHATTTAFLAQVAADTIFADDATYSEKYSKFAKSQMDYCFGDNDLNMSYVLGMGTNAKSFHHRTASGIHDDHWQSLGLSTEDSEGWQTEYAHTLYGALEGGPNQDGTFTDEVGAYQCTEVAIDYNAGFTAMLCALNEKYDNEPLANFPETETPKWAEFEVSAVVQQNQSSYTQIQLWAMNHSAWPARVVKDLSYNYYFDITEVLAAGLTVDDITVSIGYDQHASDDGKLTASEIKHYKDNIYYVNFKFGDGTVVMPTGQSEHRSEAQIRISIPDAVNGKSTAGAWDPTNDYSFQGLSEGGQEQLKSADAVTPYITMYDGDTLIWGTEPDGTTPSDVTTTAPAVTTTTTTTTTVAATTTAQVTTTEKVTTTAETPTEIVAPTTEKATETGSEDLPAVTLWGDVNVDGAVSTADAVLMNRGLSGATEISKQGQANANIYQVDATEKVKVTSVDAAYLMELIVTKLTNADCPVTTE